MIKKALIIILIFNLNLFAFDKVDEYKLMKSLVVKVHNSISIGNGNNRCVFNDEIIRYGEGHCGHFAKILVRELLKYGYDSEIVSIITYNKRNHAMVQVKLKNGKKILLDALSNIVYKYSIEEILLNTKLSQDKYFQNGNIKNYSNLSFFNTIKTLQFIPYIGTYILKNINNINVDDKLFFKKPNDIMSSFDYSYNTYSATKINASEKINLNIKFKDKDRISSIVIYPYSINDYPAKIKLNCDDITVFDQDIKLKRGMIVINFYANNKCNDLNFEFSDFKGQNRLLLRDIYIYGKEANDTCVE